MNFCLTIVPLSGYKMSKDPTQKNKNNDQKPEKNQLRRTCQRPQSRINEKHS